MENFFTKFTDSSAVFPSLPIVQHNCLGSWDVFLSLFHSFTKLPHPPHIVALQDPPSRLSKLPVFPGFLSFAHPPPGRPTVAIYVSQMLNTHLQCSSVFHDNKDMLSIDISSPEVLFHSSFCSFRVTSVYLRTRSRPPYRSIPPEDWSPPHDTPHVVFGDFNLHHPLSDPARAISDKEFNLSSPYFDAAMDRPYTLLNTPGIYTRFPFDTTTRPSVLDLSFANQQAAPLVVSWDTPLPSTGSDHVPTVTTHGPPHILLPPPTPHCDLLD